MTALAAAVALCLTVYLVQGGIGWNNIGDVQKELWKLYTEAEQKTVATSMLLSNSVQDATKLLYTAADDSAKLAVDVKIALYNNSHTVMLHNVASSRCLQGLQLEGVVKELNNAVLPSQRCLHDAADIGASIEKAVTTILVLMRAHIVQAKNALTFCQLADNQTPYRPCVEQIIKEIQSLIEHYTKKIIILKDNGIAKYNRINSTVKICQRRLKKQISKVRSIQRDVLKCKG